MWSTPEGVDVADVALLSREQLVGSRRKKDRPSIRDTKLLVKVSHNREIKYFVPSVAKNSENLLRIRSVLLLQVDS